MGVGGLGTNEETERWGYQDGGGGSVRRDILPYVNVFPTKFIALTALKINNAGINVY